MLTRRRPEGEARWPGCAVASLRAGVNSSCARGAITIPSGQRNVHLRFRAQIDQPLPIMLRCFAWRLTEFRRGSRGRIRFGEDPGRSSAGVAKEANKARPAFSKNLICASSAGMDFLMVPLRLYRNNGAISAMGRNSFIGWSGKAGSSPADRSGAHFRPWHRRSRQKKRFRCGRHGRAHRPA